MASTSPNKIFLKHNAGYDKPPFEAQANAAITPGELVDLNSTDKVIAHATANGAVTPAMIAVENPFNDGVTGNSIDHDYAANETVYYQIPQAGDEAYVYIKASENLTKGDRLGSDGAGALQEISTVDATVITNAIIAVSLETKTIGGTRERVKVRFV